jgi:hypothetical protein
MYELKTLLGTEAETNSEPEGIHEEAFCLRHKGEVLRQGGMTSSWRLITPRIAKEMLELNTKNRAIDKGTTKKYAADMREGRWITSGDTIRFSTKGVLLDGQHRLESIIESNIPSRFIVTTGVPHEAFSIIGEVRKWTTPQVLVRDGESNAKALATTAGWFVAIKNRSLNGNRGFSAIEIQEIIKDNPSLKKWAAFAAERKPFRVLFSAPVCGVAAVFAEKYGDERIELFMRQLSNGEGLSKGDPALTLREFAMKHSIKNSSFFAVLHSMQAFRAFANGEKLNAIDTTDTLDAQKRAAASGGKIKFSYKYPPI